MTYRVVITPPVSQAIRDLFSSSRNLLIRTLNRVYSELETGADVYRNDRVEGRADCFWYTKTVIHQRTWHICHFVVNDKLEDGKLFVVDFDSESRPLS